MGIIEFNDEQSINYVITLIGSFFSFISSGFIIYMYCTKTNLQSYSCKFIRYLCITDFCLAICNLYSAFMIPSYYADWLCYWQAILITYFLLSSILWTAALSHALFTVVLDTNPDFEFLQRKYLVLTYGVPVIAFVLPIVKNEYGEAEGWCWISAKGSGPTTLRFICYYIPLIIVIIYNFVQYKRIIRELEDGSIIEGVSKRLKFYPLILIITQLPLTVHRIIVFFGSSCMPIAVIGVLSASLMGLTNAVLYGFTDPVQEYVYSWCRTNEVYDNSFESLDRNSIVQTSLNR